MQPQPQIQRVSSNPLQPLSCREGVRRAGAPTAAIGVPPSALCDCAATSVPAGASWDLSIYPCLRAQHTKRTSRALRKQRRSFSPMLVTSASQMCASEERLQLCMKQSGFHELKSACLGVGCGDEKQHEGRMDRAAGSPTSDGRQISAHTCAWSGVTWRVRELSRLLNLSSSRAAAATSPPSRADPDREEHFGGRPCCHQQGKSLAAAAAVAQIDELHAQPADASAGAHGNQPLRLHAYAKSSSSSSSSPHGALHTWPS